MQEDLNKQIKEAFQDFQKQILDIQKQLLEIQENINKRKYEEIVTKVKNQ
jgi:hypothetical protein